MEFSEEALVLPFARTENNILNITLPKALFHNLTDEVKSLVTDKAGYDTDNRHIISYSKTHLLLESLFALCLALFPIFGIVICNNVRVGFRVIIFGINTIENTAEFPATLIKDRVETVGIPRVKNFLCIGRRNSCNLICTLDACFHKVNKSIVQNEIVIFRCNTQNIVEKFVTVLALILNVVDCENSFDVFISHLICIVARIIKRCESRLPIVAMNDVRLPINVRNNLKNSS